MSVEKNSKGSVNNNSQISLEEARLIWDEYKYRHDLIWKHLIRSTIAVIALLTVSYSSALEASEQLILVASILAILYIIFNFFVLSAELGLLEGVKKLHRQRQNNLYKMHTQGEKGMVGFSVRVRLYLAGLLILSIIVMVSQLKSRL